MEQIDFNYLDKLAQKYGTPFYLMDASTYLYNIKSFKSAFLSKYPRLVVGYSFKTNYVPALCNIAMGEECYAEVVSEMEYDLAKRIGFKNVIFNGPIKRESILNKALNEGSVVNLDSLYEVDNVLKYKSENPDKNVAVGLRLNIDLTDADGVSKVQCGLRVGRFGFTRKLLSEVIPSLKKNGVRIISLHGHTSSSDRAVANYGLIVSQMLSLCSDFQLDDLQYFDVGGGFFGAAAKGIDVSNKPKYSDYADIILDSCLQNEWFKRVQPNIVIEPGVSVVANVFSYVSRIFQTKEIAGQKFLSTDGTVFDVKPTLHSNNLPHTFFTKESGKGTYVANLVGSTCMEKDVILSDVYVPNSIKGGDYVKIDGVGAYTIVLTPTFIMCHRLCRLKAKKKLWSVADRHWMM
ncbi:MAG: hypothetical protein UE068_08495 [Paludibacteraceae bacterium]|nr:hypothetical protein [Paludibacteraceae bacterium]